MLMNCVFSIIILVHATRLHANTTKCTKTQINRLYRPLTGSSSSINLASDNDDLSDDEFASYESGGGSGLQLLPTHSGNVRLPLTPKTPTSGNAVGGGGKAGGKGRRGDVALMDVWDEREELFGVGDESDDDGEGLEGQGLSGSHAAGEQTNVGEEPVQGTGNASNVRHVRFEESEEGSSADR